MKDIISAEHMQTSGTSHARSPVPVAPPPPKRWSERWADFWAKITEGLEIAELWSQFKNEAKSSYRLYSKEVPVREGEQGRRASRYFEIAKAFFWAVMIKLSPAKRILLLVSLIFLLFPGFQVSTDNGQFDSSGLRIWGGIGLLALLVLEIADRITMKRDLEIAREIQLWLVPEKAPEVPGLDIAFYNRPANTVAGDYYDVFAREEGSGGAGKFVITIADVAGKSMPAALLMATFQASLKTQSSSSCGLVSLVGCVNQYACAHSRNGQRFTTAVIAEYDAVTHTLEYVNAGHNTPLLLRASGEMVKLDVGGLPLGIMKSAPYDSARLVLAPGDALMIYTDGLVEAVNEGDEEYGDDRLMSLLRMAAGQNATNGLGVMTEDLRRFIGMARQHDDITCVYVRCTA
jgi:sigma-B regulation protein RsbU (phosphoserine phosphatase)